MKHTKLLSMLVFALIVVLLNPSPAVAKAQRTPFTGTSNLGETLHPGEWTFLPSGNVLARGIIETYNDVATDPRVTGQETIVSNGNFRPAPSSELGLAGHLWGTFYIENEGGAWDGTFTSEITEGGEYFYRGVAHGSGGYEGLTGHWEAYRNGHSGPFVLSGWILEP
ncbi:MAG TPA: hypothetical protein VNA23_00775 [Anaerolineales bacterium]|nr:hypothetical protein [Anaerolineales bacterium]